MNVYPYVLSSAIRNNPTRTVFSKIAENVVCNELQNLIFSALVVFNQLGKPFCTTRAEKNFILPLGPNYVSPEYLELLNPLPPSEMFQHVMQNRTCIFMFFISCFKLQEYISIE